MGDNVIPFRAAAEPATAETALATATTEVEQAIAAAVDGVAAVSAASLNLVLEALERHMHASGYVPPAGAA